MRCIVFFCQWQIFYKFIAIIQLKTFFYKLRYGFLIVRLSKATAIVQLMKFCSLLISIPFSGLAKGIFKIVYRKR
jgi:hypothetical protein